MAFARVVDIAGLKPNAPAAASCRPMRLGITTRLGNLHKSAIVNLLNKLSNSFATK